MSFKKNITIYNVPIQNADVEIYKTEIILNDKIVIAYKFKNDGNQQLGEIQTLEIPYKIDGAINSDYLKFNSMINEAEKIIKKNVFNEQI